MIKKLFIVLTALIFLIVCALAAPWRTWDLSFPRLIGILPPEKFARLQVSSLAGEIEIRVDGELRGSVGPEGSPFLIEDVLPGQRQVKIERKTDQPGAYVAIERLVNFSEDIDTVIVYELGPSMEFSEGSIITGYRNFANGEDVRLNVIVQPEDTEVFLDGNSLGVSPIEGVKLSADMVHKLTLQQAGYESLEINLLPESEEERAKLAGYDINVEANLFLVPIRVE